MQRVVNDPKGARETALKALDVARGIEKKSYRTVPLSKTVKLLTETGDLENALRATRDQDPPQRVWSLGEIAAGQYDRGDEAAARATWREELRIAEDLKLADKVRWIQVRLADDPAALRQVERLKKERGPVELLVDVAAARALAGDAESALSLIDVLEPSDAKTRAWIRVASSLALRRKVRHP